MSDDTHRLFLVGAGFSKPAGLPLAGELVPLVRAVAAAWFRADGYSHLENAFERYGRYLEDVDPSRGFDLEDFGAWLDWEHVLRLKGSDTFSAYGNEAGLQLRWAIGKVLHDALPAELPGVYLDFASRLTTSDRVLTLNYDLVLERSFEAVGLPYRRFPGRFSEVYESHSVWDPDEPAELVLSKLHGSIDWTYFTDEQWQVDFNLGPLVDGPRPDDDELTRIAVVPQDRLSRYYSSAGAWWKSPTLLMPPSKAKPLATSPLVPLWDGVGLYSYMLGGFNVIGCSLPPGDPYVVQLVHHISTDYAAGRSKGGSLWRQRTMRVVDRRRDALSSNELLERFRFMDRSQTEFLLDGLDSDAVDRLFADD